MRLLPALIDHPDHIRFAEQEDDEKINLFLRQHWVVNTGWVIAAIFLFILPLIIVQVEQFGGSNFLSTVPSKILTQLLIVWYMLVVAFIIEKYLYWYFNVYIVTNQNLVDINFYSLLSRTIVEVSLEDVESQSSTIKGMSGSVFNFGNVKVETAAETENIVFELVPNPDLVADRIQDLKNAVQMKGGHHGPGE